ncbi:hypothetical protein ACSSZE_14465 [Acidithiobacillus caldus]
MEAQNVVSIRTLRDINEVLVENNLKEIDGEEHRRFRTHSELSATLRRAVVLLANSHTARDKVLAVQQIRQVRERIAKAPVEAQSAPAAERATPATTPATEPAAAAPRTTSVTSRSRAEPATLREPRTPERVVLATDTVTDADLRYISHCAYGAKAALSMALAKSKESDNRPGFYTILMEGADVVDPQARPRIYDWQNRISIMFTKAELVAVAAVFYGYLRECSFSSHGPAHDKGFFLERKDGGIIARMNATGRSLTVKIAAPDMVYMGGLLTRQIRAEYPWLDNEALTGLLRGAFAATPPLANDGPRSATQPGSAAREGNGARQGNTARQGNAPRGPVADQCASCGADVDQRVRDYSQQKYGQTLCLPCQKQRH